MTYYQSLILAAGASHYWPLDDPSGTTARDLAGSAPGTISGGVALNQPGYGTGKAMTFNGTTGKTQTAANVTVPLTATIEYWLKTTVPAANGAYSMLFSTRDGSGGEDIYIAIIGVSGSKYLALGCLSENRFPLGTINNGAWHHVTHVLQNGTAQTFIDGVAIATLGQARTAASVSKASLAWDAIFGGAPNFFAGSLQDVAIYPRALTPDEIAAHYAYPLKAPGLGEGDQAYLYARSGLARSGASRSAYVAPWTTVDLITRDPAGNIIGRVDLVPYIRAGSLTVTQALNDEPDTCAFTIVPTAPPEAVPTVGQEVSVQWTPGLVEFRGYCLVIQFDRRVKNQSPWVSVQCQDAMWRFDARLVTYRFPAQSITASIAFLVAWFVNDPDAPAASDFTLTNVQPAMPSIASFDVINERPSTVLRTLTAAVGGAFYVDGNDLHAWAGSLTEPGQTAPQPLTDDLASLKSFRVTHNATQLRKRVLVEGRRTSTLIPYPMMPEGSSSAGFLGLPVQDATIFAPTTGPDARYVTRIGSQWMYVEDPRTVAPDGANPPQSRVQVAYDPDNPATSFTLSIDAMDPLPPPRAWIRVGGQYTRYQSYTVSGTGTQIVLSLPSQTGGFQYGLLTVPIPVGESVEWVDGVMQLFYAGLAWDHTPGAPTDGDPTIRAQPADTPIVTLAEADRPLNGWPALEGFVQDGRYSYTGALARANADLDAFAEPLVVAEWDTDDLNAAPGRPQVIALSQTDMRDPFTTSTVTITRVDVTFPLRTLPPRRHCVGGDVKPSTFLDLVLTDES